MRQALWISRKIFWRMPRGRLDLIRPRTATCAVREMHASIRQPFHHRALLAAPPRHRCHQRALLAAPPPCRRAVTARSALSPPRRRARRR
eukprot:3027561-Pyramimonas_sp.AAC.1